MDTNNHIDDLIIRKRLPPTQRAATEKVNQIQRFDSFSHLVHFVLKVGIVLVVDHLGKSDLLSSSLQDKNQQIEHGEGFTKVLSGYMRPTAITHLYLLLWLRCVSSSS